MSRTVDSRRKHARRRKILKQAKGYWGRRSKLYRPAKNAVEKAMAYSYRDRRRRKRDFRSLWITRISAACRMRGTNYSRFMHDLKECGIILNRKALSNMAIEDPAAFDAILQKVRGTDGELASAALGEDDSN